MPAGAEVAPMKVQLDQEDRLADWAGLEVEVVAQIGLTIELDNLELLTLAVAVVVGDQRHQASALEYL
jgi:hypothetical protein